MPSSSEPLRTTCCIIGGGPAGIILGFLLARVGIDVTVLEKHKDFFRDFRGDTIHPATLNILNQLGLLDQFLRIPHQEIHRLSLLIGGTEFPFADFTNLKTPTPFIALMPQWDFLNFLASHASTLPTFHLLFEHEVTGLLESSIPGQGPVVTGVRANTPGGLIEIHAPLTVGCDGRHALSRAAAHLHVIDRGAPIDVLWFRLSRRNTDPDNAPLNFNFGSGLILINRTDYFQCGFIIAKDSFATIQPAGLPAFHAAIARLTPFLADRVDELTTWDQVKLLSVQLNHLERWHSRGLLCIGDAAHAMSPIGGVGINLAIQDAVAAANLLTKPLASAARTGYIAESVLAAVQHRRELPTRVTQTFQVFAHSFLQRALGTPGQLKAPLALRLLSPYPIFRRTLARFIGLGVRPESVQPTPTSN